MTSKNYWNKKTKKNKIWGGGESDISTQEKILLINSYSSYERRGLEATFDPKKIRRKMLHIQLFTTRLTDFY